MGQLCVSLAAMCVVMLVEGLSYSMFIPLIPDLFGTKQAGGASTFGLIQSVANAFALICGLILGRMSDLRGAKPMLVICQVHTIFSSGSVIFTSFLDTQRYLLPSAQACFAQSNRDTR